MLGERESSLGAMQDPPPGERFSGDATLNDEYGNGHNSGFGLSEDGNGTENHHGRKEQPTMQGRNKRLVAVALFLVIGVAVAAILLVQGAQENRNDSSKAALAPDIPSPTLSPSKKPTLNPTMNPTKTPTIAPSTADPTASPTSLSSAQPTSAPSLGNGSAPNQSSSSSPNSANSTLSPGNSTNTTTGVTFAPGNLSVTEVGLDLSQGLRARIIATTGQRVTYHNGSQSARSFHGNPDFGATFTDTRGNNEGGWVYVSNSEMNTTGAGGVGAITFDKDGNIIDYRMVLEGTTMNCGGGRTPWNTWVSCEEVEFFGEIYQVDPFGEIPAQKATIGSQLGRWESFSYDNRNSSDPRFFATEDHHKGTVRRFRPDPSMIDWDNPWDMLHVSGTIDYLIVTPNSAVTGGTFQWISDLEAAKNNARSYYPDSEGIDIYDGIMYVVCKRIKQMFVFDLDNGSYYNQSTVTGLFDGGPDQMQRILDSDSGDLLYFTEEGGVNAGIHARDQQDRFFTIMEGPPYIDETTGLAFSPNGKHMYIAYQKNGLLFDIWREDGYSFGGNTLNVKYHQTSA